MESESDLRFTQHEITNWVINFAASRPGDWFAASHIASQLDLPVDAVRQVLVKLTEESRWLNAFVDYECPEHDISLARTPVGQAVPQDELTCVGDQDGHEVSLSSEHATVVFEPGEPLVEYAKKA